MVPAGKSRERGACHAAAGHLRNRRWVVNCCVLFINPCHLHDRQPWGIAIAPVSPARVRWSLWSARRRRIPHVIVLHRTLQHWCKLALHAHCRELP
ncbi:hypothetical protein BDW74DRAFT_148537 [Aspergillus multicolor]|uniref:uncharacterized protein n=1 Tax=Aspergillus multicolor TaxID=41759 RepID=UPI003CCE4532